MSQMSHSPGNTKPVRSLVRRACFTLNNWTDEELSHITSTFNVWGALYCIGKEIGEQKTPHLQGYIRLKKQKEFNTLKKVNTRIHWEKCRGTEKQNLVYCKKDNNYVSTFPKTLAERILDKYENTEWKEWQKEIIDIIRENPDERSVHWYWEAKGAVGKSYLCKYLALKFDAIICTGKANDIFNQIRIWMEANPEQSPKVVIMDVPRHNIDYINYGAIESIKNGCIYSGKYEGGRCIFEHPHVVIFANEPPIKGKFSEDRWRISQIV